MSILSISDAEMAMLTINRYCHSHVEFKNLLKYFEGSASEGHVHSHIVVHSKDLHDKMQIFTRPIMITSEWEPYQIVWVNEAFTKVFGYRLDECVRHTPRMLSGEKTHTQQTRWHANDCSQSLIGYCNGAVCESVITNYTKDKKELNVEASTAYAAMTNQTHSSIQRMPRCFVTTYTVQEE